MLKMVPPAQNLSHRVELGSATFLPGVTDSSIHQGKGRENIFSCSSPGNQAAILECFLTFADLLGQGGSHEGGLEGAT